MASSPSIRRLDDGFRWPGGRRVAVAFNIAFEAWSDGRSPGIGPMGNPLPSMSFDSNARSWGEYGAARGIHRLLHVLDETHMRASVMVSGILGERAPDSVRAIARAGHEIVAHGYAQDRIPALLTDAEQRDDIARTTGALEAAAVRPTGWISPRGTPGADTWRLLVAAGYAWHGDVFDDDRPYAQTCGEGSIVAVPLTMEINDLPHAMRFGRSPQQFVDLFDLLLAHAVDDKGGALLIDVTAHAHVYGRPSGAWAYKAIAKSLEGRDDLWIATRGEIATHAAAALRLREPA